MSNVIFRFEAGGEKLVTANDGDNLLNVARLANVPSTRPAPATAPAANAV